jgi:dipeptidase E
MNLLLLSNSTDHGQPLLAHARQEIASLLAGRRLLFVPYALAEADHDAYSARVREALAPAGVAVEGLRLQGNPAAAVRAAQAAFVGGGNSFRLLRDLRRTGLRAAIADRVRGGMPYIGSSAGTNMACPTLRTTNDMPIVEPDGFDALQLVPFQINPHYLDPDPASTHMGETREERLRQFLEENDAVVLALREGSWLRVQDGRAVLGGSTAARVFRRNQEPYDVAPGTDLSFLLTTRPRYDAPD